MYENKEICAKCGGKCCKVIPGANFPEDFDMKNGDDRLIEALKRGNYCIDWWLEYRHFDLFGEPHKRYYIRPSTKGHENELYHNAWSGECIFLKENGCSLEFNDRPHNCRFLEPNENDKCKIHDGSKESASIEWIPYQYMLEDIENYL